MFSTFTRLRPVQAGFSRARVTQQNIAENKLTRDRPNCSRYRGRGLWACFEPQKLRCMLAGGYGMAFVNSTDGLGVALLLDIGKPVLQARPLLWLWRREEG